MGNEKLTYLIPVVTRIEVNTTEGIRFSCQRLLLCRSGLGGLLLLYELRGVDWECKGLLRATKYMIQN